MSDKLRDEVVRIELDKFDLWLLSHLSLYRAIGSQARGDRDILNTKTWVENVQAHTLGAMGEIALAKYLNIYYPGHFDVFNKRPDLSVHKERIEVRHRSEHDRDLIIRPKDPGDSIYVLTTGKGPEVLIHGWMYGWKAKEMFPVTSTLGINPHFVPSKHLYPISDLKQSVLLR